MTTHRINIRVEDQLHDRISAQHDHYGHKHRAETIRLILRRGLDAMEDTQ